MFENITNIHSEALDEILKTRRTVRLFSQVPLNKSDIEHIIRAGLIAPYASFPAKGKTDFRKFFIIPKDSETMVKVENIISNRLSKFVLDMEAKIGSVPFVLATKKVSDTNFTQFINAPYLLVGAERLGIPPIASESLSYSMYAMWLKAISLKIGFRPVTFIAHLRLGNDAEFCHLLDIKSGEFVLDGCALGYTADSFKPPRGNYPDYDSNVKWL